LLGFGEIFGRPAAIAGKLQNSMEQETASLFLGGGEPHEEIEKVLDSITDLVQSVRLDGSFAYVNRAWRETLGYSAAAIDRLKVSEIIHPASQEKCREVFNRLAAGEAVPPFETTFVTADGKPVQLEGSAAVSFEGGRPVMIRVVLRDVSERKLIERRLRASDDRFRKLVEESSDGIFVADSTGSIAYASPSLKRVLGFSAEELLGSSGFALVHPDDLTAAQEYFGRVLAQPLEHLTFHCRVKHKDGGWRDLDVVCTNHLNDAAVEGIVVNFRDATERRQFEDQMRHAQKLESLGVLAGGIAHDFNNLLTVILGNVELATPYVPPESPATPLLASVETAGRRAAELTREMLAYAGRAPIVRETSDLSSLVLEMSQLLATVVSRSTPLDLNLDSAPALVDGDPTQIRQLVMNLITNASEAYADRAGPIHVRTSVMYAAADVLQSPYITPAPPPGPYVCLEVIDAGSGMADEIQTRMFEPFFTTKFIGRGLGLAATLGIVRGHLGTIQVASRAGSGTTVRVLFPLAIGRASDGVPPPPVEAWTGTGRLLVVDDEDAVRRVATKMFTGAGFEVLTAGDGDAAVGLLRADTREIRAVLLDLSMPAPGLETLAAIQRTRPGVPVLVMSGYTEQDVSRAFPEQPWAGFIQKPFALSDLLRAVRRVLEPAR
jgi:PAS domain S-box-containing protein